MITQPLLAVGFLMNLVAVIFVLSAITLILVVLIQKGKGGGLGGALGGGMASNILGSKTGDFLTWFTIGLVALFLILSVVMAKYYRPSISQLDAAGTAAPVTAPAEVPAAVGQEQIPAVEETVVDEGIEVVGEAVKPDINSVEK